MTTTTGGGRFSVAFPRRFWYPACPATDLGRKRPVAITLMDTPLALFRDRAGRARALVDRCPHRNVPLSLGRVDDGCLECAYHGWRFGADGTCVTVPGLPAGEPAATRTRAAATYPTCERDGFVWVWADPEHGPEGEPFALPRLDGKQCGETVFAYDLDCTVHAALENALDVPHTAFLHRGLFRGGTPREITAVRRAVPGGIEVQYLGEPVGMGSIRGRQGAGRTFDHWDRFFLPSIAQIEYRVDGWLHIINTILHLPLSELRTRAWFVVRYWTRLPAAVAAPIVRARGMQILRQDAHMLAEQTANASRFGGERYTSTDLDVMGNAIWRMLRQAERAEQATVDTGIDVDAEGEGDGEPLERTLTLRV